MAIDVLEVSAPGLAYIVLGGFVVFFSMGSLLVKERLYINEVVLGTAFGVLMGPYCAGVFDPRAWGTHEHTITLEVMRIVLATGLFAIGVELPKAYLREHARGLALMVIPTMAFGWVVVAGILKALMPNLNFISCLAISACLTPTDPIISAAIVGGKFATKHVPLNLRRILSAESAANDGLAYPFLTIALYLTVEPTTRAAIGRWFLIGWLYEVILGVVLGAVIGLGFCHIMKYTLRKGFIDQESYVAQYLALAILTIGVCSVLGSDDLLGAFAAGSAISWDGHFNTQVEGEAFATVIDLILNCGCFVYIGAWLPFGSFNTPALGIELWKLFVLFVAILALRRIPALLLMYRAIPEITSWREALFSGHFGPMGVGAVFISTLAVTRLPSPASPPQNQEQLLASVLQPIVAFVVLGSICVHGLSIPFFTIGKRVSSRTISLRHTLSMRAVPEWLSSTRRMDGASAPDGDSTGTGNGDIELGARDESAHSIASGAPGAGPDTPKTPVLKGLHVATPVEDDGARTPAGVHFLDDFATLRSRLRLRVDRDAERELARTRSSSGAASPPVFRSPGTDAGASGAGVPMPESDGGARTPAGVRFEDDGVDLPARLRARLAQDMRGRSASASQPNSGAATPARARSAERRVDGAATPASARSASAERGPGAE